MKLNKLNTESLNTSHETKQQQKMKTKWKTVSKYIAHIKSMLLWLVNCYFVVVVVAAADRGYLRALYIYILLLMFVVWFASHRHRLSSSCFCCSKRMIYTRLSFFLFFSLSRSRSLPST